MSQLHLAGTYRREVGASLARIWENVLDWEHLPSLHASSFAAVELLDHHPLGWRIRLHTEPGSPDAAQVLRLDVDRPNLRYRVTTEAGPGVTSEIRVQLAERAAHATGIVVELHAPVDDPARRTVIGVRFVEAYARLWDEDEAMMRQREAALARDRDGPSPDRVALGGEAEVRQGLPWLFDFGAARFRLVELDGALVAHSVTCPHWLGPLDAVPVEGGCVRCPWHGYVFDVASGRSADGRGLRLAAAPRIAVEGGEVIALRP